MLVGIADTHTVIWQIFGNPQLSNNARQFIANAAVNGNKVGVSSITLIEMVYLIERSKIPAESFTRFARMLNDPRAVFTEIPLDLKLARALMLVDATKIPDMPDRIIAATALSLNVPVISKDSKIRLSSITTIW